MPFIRRRRSSRALRLSASRTYRLIVPSKIPSCDCMLTSRMLMLKSLVTTFARSSSSPMRSMPRISIFDNGDNFLHCDHCISSFMMHSPCCDARRLSSSHEALCTIIWCVMGSLKPTTLSPGMGLQQSAMTNVGVSCAGCCALPSFCSCVVSVSSSASSSLFLMKSVQNFSSLFFAFDLTTFSRLSSEIIPAPIFVYNSSLVLLS